MLHLCHVRRVTLRSVRSKRSYRKRARLGLVGCFGHCCFFAQWGQEDRLEFIWGRGPPGHPGECMCPSQPQPFMSVCLASPALGLTLAKSVPPGDPIFVSLASLLWGRHQDWEPCVTDGRLSSTDMVMDTRGTGVTA